MISILLLFSTHIKKPPIIFFRFWSWQSFSYRIPFHKLIIFDKILIKVPPLPLKTIVNSLQQKINDCKGNKHSNGNNWGFNIIPSQKPICGYTGEFNVKSIECKVSNTNKQSLKYLISSHHTISYIWINKTNNCRNSVNSNFISPLPYINSPMKCIMHNEDPIYYYSHCIHYYSHTVDKMMKSQHTIILWHLFILYHSNRLKYWKCCYHCCVITPIN